jgi:hypothetical protein
MTLSWVRIDTKDSVLSLFERSERGVTEAVVQAERELAISDSPTQAKIQPLRDKAEQPASNLRALSTLIHSLRTALVGAGLVRGSA